VFVGHRLGLDADTAGRAGAAALAAHGFADGIALGVARGTALGLVVALHTAPLALATWRLGSAALGRPVAAGLLAASGLGTVAGYAAGATWAGTQSVAWIAALTSGMLLAAAAHGSPNR
jgi:hypothetical protein